MASSSWLHFDDVSIEYSVRHKPIRAVDGASMKIGHASFLSILGPSGCGKTSLLKSVAGLLPKSTRGQILLGTERLDQRSKSANKVGMVFQTAALLDWLTVRDNVAFPLTSTGGKRRPARELADELLAEAGLSKFARSKPYELSGGMQQRVAICRALIVEPELLLMDEPFGHLDAITRDQMSIMTQALWLRKPITAVLVTHSVAEAVFLSDRVAVMSKGPGSKVVTEIDIDLPRPRTLASRRSAAFQEYVRELENILGIDQVEA